MNKSIVIPLLITAIAYLTLGSGAVAISKPAACPSPDSLRGAVWVIEQNKDHPNLYGAGVVSNFGTDREWMAGINCITATSESEARQIIAHSILSNVPERADIQGGSISANNSVTWICVYKTTYQFPGNCYNSIYALTPVPTKELKNKLTK